MAVLIDTSVLIAYERGQIDIAEQVGGREGEQFFVSVITASEMLHGVHRADSPGTRSRRLAFVESVLARVPILDIDLAIARSHAQLWSTPAAQGLMIGVHDSWLAATCIAYDLTLITANRREFERVPGLTTETWAPGHR